MSLTIVIPTYRDDDHLRRLLGELKTALEAGQFAHTTIVRVADGGSSLATQDVVNQFGFDYLAAPRGRGMQITAGIAGSATDWYWVLHADSHCNASVWTELTRIVTAKSPCWGRFNVRIPGLPWLSLAMNLRSRLTKICTGDQGMFVHADFLNAIGGFPAQPLMEDIELSRQLRRYAGSSFVAAPAALRTSSRRWRERGVVRTVIQMWRFRLRYWRGADPEVLFDEYYGT